MLLELSTGIVFSFHFFTLSERAASIWYIAPLSHQAEEEIRLWEEAADEWDGGRGIPLKQCRPDNEKEMDFVYGSLKVTDLFAKIRLREYIHSLRPEENKTITWKQVAPRDLSHGHELLERDDVACQLWNPL